MGIGSRRSKGDRDQFKALEDIYTIKSRSLQGRQKLRDYLAYLVANPGKTTCDGLAESLEVPNLGPDAVTAINQNWYAIKGQAQWRYDSELTPEQIQLVNRAATTYYLGQLIALAEQYEEARLEIWGQCRHPGFSIEVSTSVPGANDASGEPPYVTVDYYVPFNSGEYGGTDVTFNRYPGTNEENSWPPADPGHVADLEVEGSAGTRRFSYAVAGPAQGA